MAITGQGAQAGYSAIGSKTVNVFTSTNSGNDGFMYVLEYEIASIGVSGIAYYSPNPNGALVLELNNFVKPYMRHSSAQNTATNQSIHALAANTIGEFEEPVLNYQCAGVLQIDYIVKEAWNIDGVLTPTSVGQFVGGAQYHNAQLSLQQGLNFDFGDYLENNRAFITDREVGTHLFDKANQIGLSNDAIYIPTYESDWGVMSLRISPVITGYYLKISLLPNSGPPVQFDTPLQEGYPFINAGLYPANLNASPIAGIPKPQDYPNWKAVYYQIYNSDDLLISKSIVMYNAARFGPCYGDQTKISLAWVGRYGGWERSNFCQNSFEEYATEKKIAYRAIGNYGDVSGSTPFAFNSFDESEIVTDMAVQKFINASSDWVQDGEREFLKGLFLSKQVHWVQDDGSHIPVIVQSDGYQVKKVYGRGPLFKLDIKVKIAQEQFN